MLIIKPIQDKKDQEEYCALCGCEYDVDCLAYGAFVDERLVGVCQFIYRTDGAHIVSLRQAKEEDDLDRAVYNGASGDELHRPVGNTQGVVRRRHRRHDR